MNDIEVLLNERPPFLYRESDRISLVAIFIGIIFNLQGLLYGVALIYSLSYFVNLWLGLRIFGLKDRGLPRRSRMTNVSTVLLALLFVVFLGYSVSQLWLNRSQEGLWLWFAVGTSLMLMMYVGRVIWARAKLAPLISNPSKREELRNALVKRMKYPPPNRV